MQAQSPFYFSVHFDTPHVLGSPAEIQVFRKGSVNCEVMRVGGLNTANSWAKHIRCRNICGVIKRICMSMHQRTTMTLLCVDGILMFARFFFLSTHKPLKLPMFLSGLISAVVSAFLATSSQFPDPAYATAILSQQFVLLLANSTNQSLPGPLPTIPSQNSQKTRSKSIGPAPRRPELLKAET